MFGRGDHYCYVASHSAPTFSFYHLTAFTMTLKWAMWTVPLKYESVASRYCGCEPSVFGWRLSLVFMLPDALSDLAFCIALSGPFIDSLHHAALRCL